MALVFGGLVQVLAGVADIRYNEQLGGTALTMYGFFWFTVSLAQLVSMGTTFHFDSALFVPINFVYAFLSAVMVYLTAYRSVGAISTSQFTTRRLGGTTGCDMRLVAGRAS